MGGGVTVVGVSCRFRVARVIDFLRTAPVFLFWLVALPMLLIPFVFFVGAVLILWVVDCCLHVGRCIYEVVRDGVVDSSR